MISTVFSSVAAWAVAASTGAIAAWVLSYIRERWNRPKLSLEIDLGLGSVVESETDKKAPVKHARLVVRNKGRTLARNCCASIDYIRRTDPTGSHYVFHSDLIDLYWSLQVNGTSLFNVPSRGYRLIDVGQTYVAKENGSDIIKFWITGAIIPNRLVSELKINATYDLHIRAYADNAAPVEIACRITVGNTYRNLDLQPCADPRPRDQR
jgi:hypothetical protein